MEKNTEVPRWVIVIGIVLMLVTLTFTHLYEIKVVGKEKEIRLIKKPQKIAAFSFIYFYYFSSTEVIVIGVIGLSLASVSTL